MSMREETFPRKNVKFSFFLVGKLRLPLVKYLAQGHTENILPGTSWQAGHPTFRGQVPLIAHCLPCPVIWRLKSLKAKGVCEKKQGP